MENVSVRKINNCRLCRSKNLKNLFNLKSTPPANSYVKKSDLNKSLKIQRCFAGRMWLTERLSLASNLPIQKESF